jgi:hypothetical protein
LGIELLKLGIELLKLNIELLKLNIELLKLDIKLLKLYIELLKLDIELLKLDTELLKLDIELLRLDIKLLKQSPFSPSPSTGMFGFTTSFMINAIISVFLYHMVCFSLFKIYALAAVVSYYMFASFMLVKEIFCDVSCPLQRLL